MNNPFKDKLPKFARTESEESRNLHNRDDLDSSHTAHHHSLGTGSTQAAPGNHTHGFVTGDVKSSYAEADNVEWFELNGQASPTEALAAMFGPNLPDLRDRVIIGAGPAKALASTGGSFGVTLATGNLPPHTHGIDHDHGAFTTAAGGAHTHDVVYRESASSGGPQNIAATGAGTAVTRTVATTSETHTHSIDVPAFTGSSSNGGFANTSVDITPKYAALKMLVHA